MASALVFSGNALSDDWLAFLAVTDSSGTTPIIAPTVVVTPGIATTSSTQTPTPNLSIQSPGFWNLLFNTGENNTRFKDPAYDLNGSILLGLSATLPQNTNFTADSVLSQFGITPASRQNNGIVTTILSNLGDDFSLSLNNTDERSAMWLTPGMTFRSDTALSFTPRTITGFADTVTNSLAHEFGFTTLPQIDLTIYLQRSCFGFQYMNSNNAPTWSLKSSYRLTFKLTTGGLNFWLSLTPTGVSCSLTQVPGGNFWQSLANIGANNPNESSMPVLTAILSAVTPLQISLGRDLGGNNRWQVKVSLQWERLPSQGSTTNPDPVQLYITYDSASSTLIGGLITAGFYATDEDKKSYGYQIGTDLDAPTNLTVPAYWDLKTLSKELDTLPDGIPTAISAAYISYSAGTIFFTATLIRPQTVTSSVPFPLTWDKLEVRVSKSSSIFTCAATTVFTLHPRVGDESKYSPANLSVGVSYGTNTGWELSCQVSNLQFGILSDYFPTDFRQSMLEVLGLLQIKSLSLDYTFNSDRAASSFFMTGDILIGGLEMVFFYQYARSDEPNPAASKKLPAKSPKLLVVKPKGGAVQTDWRFEAYLGPSQPASTIGSIADSIMSGASAKLPDFVSAIAVNPPAANEGAITLEVSKTTENGTNQVMFRLTIQIDQIEVTFVQISGDGASQNKAKQILRVSVDSLPQIGGIPLLPELTQPFQKLAYHWVRDANGSNGTGGFTQAELDSINTNILPQDNPIMYKAATSNRSEQQGLVVAGNSPTASSSPVVMAVGHHFVVVENNETVLDHCFNNATSGQPTNTSPKPASTAPRDPSQEANDPAETDADPAPSKGALTKSTAFLSITGLALQFKSGVLWITMDATVTLGPLSVSLLGFGIGVPTTGFTINRLSSLDAADLERFLLNINWQLHGLAIAFNKPPMMIAGEFDHDEVTNNGVTQDYYRGGIAITIPPYAFVAVGEESVVTQGSNKYNSVFMYGRLDGPIITLEIASINGLRLGYGVNTIVRQPTGAELYGFPLIADTGAGTAGNDPAKILDVLTVKGLDGGPPWIDVKQDAWWFAFGMTIDACDILNVTAVAMIGFKDPAIVFTLLGDAVLQMPSTNAPKEGSLVYMQMNIVAELSVVWHVQQVPGVPAPVPIPAGYFTAQGALAPSSFALVPFCNVYGGFAVCFWFGIPSIDPHVGDFVVSIGGYHPAFDAPAWYPVVNRIGMSMTIGDNINVTGEAYFAVTPKVAMVGGLLHASLSVGPVDAYFDATFDALINFYPVHYVIDVRVSVGVEFSLDILFVHIHISCHVGADLHIAGPDFGGKAHVDFYLFGFDVYFGNQNDVPSPLSLSDFYQIVHKSEPTQEIATTSSGTLATPPVTRQINPQMCNLAFALEDGAFIVPQRSTTVNKDGTDPPIPNTGAGSVWNVKGGTFQFRISTEIPISQAYIRYPLPSDGTTPSPVEGPVAPLPSGAAPTPGTNPAPTPTKQPADMNDPADPHRFPIIPLTALNPVFAKPMQLTTVPLTSELTVSITDSNGKLVDKLQLFYVRKPVPTSSWGVYNSEKDPNLVSAQAALTGIDNTIDLAMALSIHSPPPILSQSLIPAFNATAASRLEIPRSISTDASGVMTPLHWQLPAPEPIQSQGLPGQQFEAAQLAPTQWSDMQQTWIKSFNQTIVGDTSGGILAFTATLLGWDQAVLGSSSSSIGTGIPEVPAPAAGVAVAPVGTPVMEQVMRQPWQLVGGVPTILVGDGKDANAGLAEYYLGLPRVSDGVSALGLAIAAF